eukprot:5113731-Lingulodinium_polyedra.AAC.1
MELWNRREESRRIICGPLAFTEALENMRGVARAHVRVFVVADRPQHEPQQGLANFNILPLPT